MFEVDLDLRVPLSLQYGKKERWDAFLRGIVWTSAIRN
jgi:hypothetical protein